MSKKNGVSSVKGLVVRSVEESRNRAGYSFSSVPQFIDVQRDELSDEDIDAITSDRYLMAVEVDKVPKGMSIAQRRNADGSEWQVGNYAIGNATLETATVEMIEEAKEGRLESMHPTAPGGEPTRPGFIHPDAVEENLKRLEQQQMPEGKTAATAPKRGRGRPSTKKGPTAKTSSRDGDKHTRAGEGTSAANAE